MIGQPLIPFVDLVAPHAELREELVDVFVASLDSAAFIGGPVVEAFERQFARYCEVSDCIGVGSGTDALRFALLAGGVSKNDLVVTVPNTFIATTEAISQAGARPVFVDIDERTYNMDPARLQDYLENHCHVDRHSGELIDDRLGRRVAAVVPVHLYGQPADMDPILNMAERFKLLVVEDACQAHGAEYFSQRDDRWMRVGSIGRAAAFSFYPGKNLGACGEAGAVTTSDPELARRVRMLRDHGQSQKYFHHIEGYNGRLDAIQAGILSLKLGRLDAWTRMRREAAQRYRQLLAGVGGKAILPHEPSWCRSVYHLFVIRVENRDDFTKSLSERGIATGIHYPIPLHLQAAYQDYGFGVGDLPVAELAAMEIVSLPMFPTLRADQQAAIAQEIGATVSRAAA